MKLTPLQERVLYLNRQGLTQLKIAEILHIQQSAVSRCINSIERVRGIEVDRHWRHGAKPLPSMDELKSMFSVTEHNNNTSDNTNTKDSNVVR